LLEKVKAEVALEGSNQRLATKRLALAEAELSNISIRSQGDPSIINSPAKKVNKTKTGDGDPPGGDPEPDNDTAEYISSGLPSIQDSFNLEQEVASPLIKEEIRPIEPPVLPNIRLNLESLKRHQIPTPEAERYEIHTLALSQQQASLAAEKEGLKQQEMLIEQAAYELIEEHNHIGDSKNALREASSKVQPRHGFNALTMALAEQRLKEQEINANETYEKAESNLRLRAEVMAQEMKNAGDEQLRRAAEQERFLEGKAKDINAEHQQAEARLIER